MKKSSLVLVAVLMSVVAMAQAPQKMTYQAVVRDNDGHLVSNGNVGVRITIVRGSETGAEVYSQTETVRTNDNGLFTTMIGGDGFDAIDWSNGPYFMKSEVDPDGGSNYTLTTTQQMVSVPYALHAGTVDNIVGGVNITETDPVFTAWDKDYNDLINKPTIPTNISELNNDAGYLTSFTETQVLSISNDTIYLTGGSFVKLPAGFSGDYNDLLNRPNFADSVSQIVNEYHLGDTIINYISQNGYVDSSYIINYNIQQGYVDTTYVTNYINNSGAVTSESDPVFTAWNKDYNDLTNKPTIPTVPTNVSEFTNDAGYLTSFTEAQVLSISNDTIYLTGGSYVKLPATVSFSGDYNDLTNKPTIPTVPTNVSEFTNDAGYITSYTETDPVFSAWNKDYNDLTNKPTIPTVPTNVSEFTNDAGYLTSFTEAQVLSIGHDTIYLTGGSFVKLPAGFSGDYNDLTNKPTIPTVPTSVSEFTNDAGYITSAGVPTNVSELTNDAGYLTSFTEAQVLSIGHDTIYLTGGSFVKLPAGFSGNYNDLTNKPDIPTVPTNISEFTNDAGYITSYSETDPVFTAWDKDYNDLTNKPTIPTVPTNVSDFNNDAGYLTSYTETQTLANVATQGNAVEAQIKQLSDPTEELDAVNLRTLNITINNIVTDWGHRFDSLAHRYDSIANRMDSIIAYQDSVIDTLSSLLTELSATTGDTTAVECERFTWYGTEYMVSGDYQHRLTNVAGFDSVLTLHLTINHGTHNSENQAACDSYTWHGNNYTAIGTYTYDYTNCVGCASTDTLHLTINPSTAATDSHTECESYTWIDGNIYIASNSTATHTLTNAAGCDSVVTMNLTINYGTHNAETQNAAGDYSWHGTTYNVTGDYTYSYTNAEGCASVDTLHLTIGGFDENGASVALFSVSSTRQVRFSKGNLQYTTSGTHTVIDVGTAAGTWRFAEHQYDIIGSANSNISSSYTGWIDLFGWGTSGWNSGANAYQPWTTSSSYSDYYPGRSYTNNLTGIYDRADWGVYNAISNGGNQPGMWRTLTKAEWSYLITTRSASTVGGTANARYAKATVNGTSGVIIFPDTFTLPTGMTVTNVNNSSGAYTSNTYTSSQWGQLEAAGCIFLPAAGSRSGTGVHFVDTGGDYWSSGCNGEYDAWNMYFVSGNVNMSGYGRSGGISVRLVRD